MLHYVPVAGTHSWRGKLSDDWWCPGSPFTTGLAARGCYLIAPDQPFIWNTGLGGVPLKGHHDWIAAGEALYTYLRPIRRAGVAYDEDYVPIVDRNLICHSHGLQVVLYACARGLKINSLISVMSPVRSDLLTTTARARPNIGHWLHLHSDRSDWIQIAGAVWDGAFGIFRESAFANRNRLIGGVGHSKLLHEPAWLPHWAAWLKESADAGTLALR